MPVTPEIDAPLIEVFSSIQGEGVLIGARQIFVRFADCNLSCDYCDTPFQAGPFCRVETRPGAGQFNELPNPVKLSLITELVERWQYDNSKLHHSLVLTGGEPLLHADILKVWLPDMLSRLPVFLETNGTLPEELDKVLDFIDMVSMDVKGSSLTGVPTPWQNHADFISLAGDRLYQIKLVIDKTTPDSEILEATQLAHRYAPDVPFILQPRTNLSGLSLNGDELLSAQLLASAEHPDVRIIPQIHPWLGVA